MMNVLLYTSAVPDSMASAATFDLNWCASGTCWA